MFLKKMASRILEMDQESKVYDLTYEEYCQKKIENTLIESVKVEKNESQKTFQDMKALKNRVVKLENLLEEAEKDLEALRELRFEPEYYQDFQKMDQLNECIDLKHNEINSLMKEWEEKMQILEEH